MRFYNKYPISISLFLSLPLFLFVAFQMLFSVLNMCDNDNWREFHSYDFSFTQIFSACAHVMGVFRVQSGES